MTLIGFLPKPHEPCRTMIGYFYFVSHFFNISFLTRTLVQGSSLSGTTIGMNRCSSFLLLSAPHSLFSICTNVKRSEKIPGTPTRRWGEWIWLTWPSRLHRNSPQGLNISSIRVFDQIRDPEIPLFIIGG